MQKYDIIGGLMNDSKPKTTIKILLIKSFTLRMDSSHHVLPQMGLHLQHTVVGWNNNK